MEQLKQGQYMSQSGRLDGIDQRQPNTENSQIEILRKELSVLKENYEKLLPEIQSISKEKSMSDKENYLLFLELKEKQGNLNNSQTLLQREYQQSNLETKIQVEVLKKEMDSNKGRQIKFMF